MDHISFKRARAKANARAHTDGALCKRGNSERREMADSVSAVPLQRRLESCAASVGYGGKIRGLPKEAGSSEKAAHFLQWLCQQMIPANAFSQAELDR